MGALELDAILLIIATHQLKSLEKAEWQQSWCIVKPMQ
jgi:hypothetical protein